MICRSCNNKMTRDHVKDGNDYMVCLNKQCPNYGITKNESGTKSKMEIKEKK